MANRFLSNITINDQYTFPSSDGADGQILSTTGAADGTTELQFIDQGDVVAGEADKAKSVILRVKNSTGSPMSKGQVVCEAVSATPPNGNLIEVALADNNGTNTMPALGILNEDLDAAGGNNDEGDAIMFGKVSGIDTSAFSVGDEVFVDDTPGGLTTTKPTGVKYIQKVGVVIRDDDSNGTIEVFGAGRVNDVPTPLYVDHANQRLGIGATSPNAKLDIRDGELHFTSSFPNQNPSGKIRFNEYGAGATVTGAYMEYNGSGNYFSMLTNNEVANHEFLRALRGSHLLLQPSSGNVGIGTTSPQAKLHISESNAPTIKFSPINPGSYPTYGKIETNTGFLTWANVTLPGGIVGSRWQHTGPLLSGRGDTYINLHDTNGIDIIVNDSQVVKIEDGGNVGIGTDNPSQKLDVVGSIEVSDGIYIGGTAASNKLDDYEEGTYNFAMQTSSTVYSGNTGNFGSQYDNQSTYTKIGPVVHVFLRVKFNAHPYDWSFTSASIYLTNLPFSPVAGTLGGNFGFSWNSDLTSTEEARFYGNSGHLGQPYTTTNGWVYLSPQGRYNSGYYSYWGYASSLRANDFPGNDPAGSNYLTGQFTYTTNS